MAVYPNGTNEKPCSVRRLQRSHAFGSGPVTVLIVEDDLANLQLATYCMEMAGYHTIAASNGEQAVHLALTHQPDIVLMDIRMPVMSGCDAIELIKRSSAAEIGIIAVTAMATEEEKQWIKASGCNDYIAKPYLVETLLDRVSALLLTRQGDQQFPRD